MAEPARRRRSLADFTGAPSATPLLVLTGFAFADEFERLSFAILLPTMRDAFDASLDGVVLLAGVVGLLLLGLALPVGHLADRVQRTRLAAGGAALWAGCAVLTGMAGNLAVLLLARAGSGLARATTIATHDSLIADHHAIDRRVAAYGIHRGGASVAQFLAPAAVGVVAFYLSWRSPFLVIGGVTLVLALFAAFRISEPVRGAHERRVGGAAEATVDIEEAPASFDEACRTLNQIGTVRRLWFALPLIGVAAVGVGPMVQLFYDEVFGLSLAERATITALTEPAQILGYVVVVPLALRLMRLDPVRVVHLLATLCAAVAVLVLFLSLAPNLGTAMVLSAALALGRAGIAPLVAAVFSLVLPPRVRSLGFAIVGVLLAAAQIGTPVAALLVDGWGPRGSLALLVLPIGLGAYLAVAAGTGLGSDIARVRSAAVASAEIRAARMRGEAKSVTVRDLDVSYSGVQVLFGVDFEVGEGEIVALLGTNGAGKSTLLKAISGLVDVDGGAIIFDGRDMTYAPPNEVVAKGVLQVPGGRGIFGSLTVAENMRTAAWLYRHDPDHVRWAVREILIRFPRLRERWLQPAANLSGGEQQMLTLGMAFIAKPRLLMIDELSLGLAPTVVEQLLEMVELIRESGTTIIVVEQSVNMALTIAEKAFFMEKGEIRFEGPTAELLDRPDILRSVFLEGASSLIGGEAAVGQAPGVSRPVAEPDADAGDVVLDADGLTKVYGVFAAVDDVSLAVRQREILGVIGPNGAGKTTLFDLLSGHIGPSHGRIRFLGSDVTGLRADARARLGIGRSFQDAWLFPGLTVAETITLASERRRNVEWLDPIAAALRLPGVARWERRVGARTDELIEMMGLTAFRDKFVSELSTGSRRMVDLACMVAQEPEVILLDEPSSGIAQRETEALGPILLAIRAATGAAMVVIEHDMNLITSISDELIALDRGSVITRGAPRDVIADEVVVLSYLGSSPDVIARSGERHQPTAHPTTRTSTTQDIDHSHT